MICMNPAEDDARWWLSGPLKKPEQNLTPSPVKCGNFKFTQKIPGEFRIPGVPLYNLGGSNPSRVISRGMIQWSPRSLWRCFFLWGEELGSRRSTNLCGLNNCLLVKSFTCIAIVGDEISCSLKLPDAASIQNLPWIMIAFYIHLFKMQGGPLLVGNGVISPYL